MPRMVYIKEINFRTFLHFNANRNSGSYCLRDYSVGPTTEPNQNRQTTGRTLADIDRMLLLPGNFAEHAPDDQSLEQFKLWYSYTKKLNRKYFPFFNYRVVIRLVVATILAVVAAAVAIVSERVFGVKLH